MFACLLSVQVESISTLNFAARCMRVVARQRVNEVLSDSLLLERARRQISALRRRLVEAEAAAAIASSPAPSDPPLALTTVDQPRAPAQGHHPRPPLAAETKAVVPVTPDTRDVPSDEHGDDGSNTVECDEAVRCGGRQRCDRHAFLVGIPRGARPPEQLPGGELVGNGTNNHTRASGGADVLTLEASARRRCANTAANAPVLIMKSEARGSAPLHADERRLDGNGQPTPPPPSSSLSGGIDGRIEGEVKAKTLLNARRGRDIVVRGKIATAVAAANAAAAAAAAVASAISATGGGRIRHAPASQHATPTVTSTGMRHGSSRESAVSQLCKPKDGSRGTSAARKPALRSSCSTKPGRREPPTRAARSPGGASTNGGRGAAGKGDADERHVATKALIERFSTREDELLRELEAWKARCKSLEKKEAPPPRSVAGGCAGDDHRSGEISQIGIRENSARLQASLSATRAIPPAATPAQPHRLLQAFSRTSSANAAVRLSGQQAPNASQTSADPHRSACCNAVSVPNRIVPEKDRNVDPRRRASVEVSVPEITAMT